MVGFINSIVFNNNGKIIDYQKSYNDNYSKILNIYLPLNYNNKKNYTAKLYMAIDNTYPREIISVQGNKSDTDLNKYIFDVTEIFKEQYIKQKRKPGLCRIKLSVDDGRIKFESESFRL